MPRKKFLASKTDRDTLLKAAADLSQTRQKHEKEVFEHGVLLRKAQHEIRQLRARTEVLAAKEHVFEGMLACVLAQPQQRHVAISRDVVQEINELLARRPMQSIRVDKHGNSTLGRERADGDDSAQRSLQ